MTEIYVIQSIYEKNATDGIEYFTDMEDAMYIDTALNDARNVLAKVRGESKGEF